VLVTSFSNALGASHGTFSSDANAFSWVEIEPSLPILNIRLEDATALGVSGWAGLEGIPRARLTWDVDLSEVGDSGYVVARVPGLDSTAAVILGAHIDSSNTPGALDDGSGSVTLLEIARVLDRAGITPPVDLYLVWFGSHERGLYGSFNFTADHSELLDRTLAMLQMDCLGHPLDGITNVLAIQSWPYGRFGDPRLTLADYLESVSDPLSAAIEAVAYYGLGSDHSSFAPYDVPNALLIFENPYHEAEIHYANHLHDPYDTVELAALETDAFLDMARILLTAALRIGADRPALRVTPPPERRAVFVASHTEAIHMTPAGLTELGMAFAMEGCDVDTVPYGQPVTAADLADADMVVVLPVHDYPSPAVDVSLYDEAWRSDEIDVLESYVRGGGTMVLTNSANRLKYLNRAYEQNEDLQDQNALASRFGITYYPRTLDGTVAEPVGSHPLMAGVDQLELVADNAVRFSTSSGQPIARASGAAAIAVVPVDSGEVIVLADLGLLGARGDGPPVNLRFWQNLARRAR
jgi:hypothetical protein